MMARAQANDDGDERAEKIGLVYRPVDRCGLSGFGLLWANMV